MIEHHSHHRERRRQFIDQLQRSLEPTVHLCPQEGSPMDSQSKPRRNVVNCRSLEMTKDGQLSEWHFHWKKNSSLVRLWIVIPFDPVSSSWRKTLARNIYVIPTDYLNRPCSQHGCSAHVIQKVVRPWPFLNSLKLTTFRRGLDCESIGDPSWGQRCTVGSRDLCNLSI